MQFTDFKNGVHFAYEFTCADKNNKTKVGDHFISSERFQKQK